MAHPAVPPAHPAVAPAPEASGRHRQLVLLGLAAALALAAETAALAARSGIVSDGPAAALAVLRVGLGIPAVLCVPGYALTVFLYPRGRDLDAFERIALTVGLSVAQIPLVVLLVDRSPWGLSSPATVASLAALSCLWCFLAALRVARLPAAGPDGGWPLEVTGVVAPPARGRRALPSWAGASRWDRAAVLAAAGLVGLVAWALLTITTHRGVPPLTEFFVLGQQGLAEDYPRTAVPGRPVQVSVGIVNREGREEEYRIVIRQRQESLTQTPPVRLGAGESWTGDVSFVLTEYGFGQRVELLLLRGAAPEPYRRLQLVVDVPAPGEPTPVRALQTPAPRR
ncbi:MAG TPA: DUF1616 domain-containing protein [Chloroflexota bacterium]|nr:DUF1616 domain-containing protein [Chloroflexota bacterium]